MNINRFLFFTLIVWSALRTMALDVQWMSSTDKHRWQPRTDITVTDFKQDEVNDVIVTRYREQQMMGFGGCFGAVGGLAQGGGDCGGHGVPFVLGGCPAGVSGGAWGG